MKIIKLEPSGFCFGVKRSIDKTLDILKNKHNKKIYLLGWLVHNRNVINKLKQYNFILLDDKEKSRYELISELNKTSNNDIIIFSAHGTDYRAIELAKQKGYDTIDLTCPYVYKTHLLIKQKLNEGYDVFFIGKKNHPETKAILKINNNIKLITNINDIKLYNFTNNKIFCTNQTTLSIFEIKDLITELKKQNNNIEFINDICDATTKRQEALMNINNDIDIILVLGDTKSSNSQELYKIAKQKTDSYLISNYQDINIQWFNNKNKCLIVSAASSSDDIANEVMVFLKKEFNEY